ncbi:MAG: glycosyltransferase, partial [Ginsengibacter sp.]
KKCMQQIKDLPQNIRVEYYGDIEQVKVEKALLHSHIFILPSKSENFGHAIFEALSAGRPVITSNYTPWKYLQHSKAGINAETEIISLQNAINSFALMEQAEYNLWSKNASEYAASAINLGEIKKQYKNMFTLQND